MKLLRRWKLGTHEVYDLLEYNRVAADVQQATGPATHKIIYKKDLSTIKLKDLLTLTKRRMLTDNPTGQGSCSGPNVYVGVAVQM